MIEKFNNKKRNKDDIILLITIILLFAFIVWLCSPPGNKVAQMFWISNNIEYRLAKLFNPTMDDDWKFYRANAEYLSQMNNPKQAIFEINKAIDSYPINAPIQMLDRLHKDRALLKIVNHDFKGALDDYMVVQDKSYSINDRLRIGLLYHKIGNNKLSLYYCNSIFKIDSISFDGIACLSYVYGELGYPKIAVNLYDVLIDKNQNRAAYYVERSRYKKMLGDIQSANDDIQKAKELAPSINIDSFYIDTILQPKGADLPKI